MKVVCAVGRGCGPTNRDEDLDNKRSLIRAGPAEVMEWLCK